MDTMVEGKSATKIRVTSVRAIKDYFEPENKEQLGPIEKFVLNVLKLLRYEFVKNEFEYWIDNSNIKDKDSIRACKKDLCVLLCNPTGYCKMNKKGKIFRIWIKEEFDKL